MWIHIYIYNIYIYICVCVCVGRENKSRHFLRRTEHTALLPMWCWCHFSGYREATYITIKIHVANEPRSSAHSLIRLLHSFTSPCSCRDCTKQGQLIWISIWKWVVCSVSTLKSLRSSGNVSIRSGCIHIDMHIFQKNWAIFLKLWKGWKGSNK